MSKAVANKSQDNLPAPPATAFETVDDALMRDAFTALSLSILRDNMITSDTKYFIFQGMMENLKKMGCPQDKGEVFRNAMNEAIKKFSITSDFMG